MESAAPADALPRSSADTPWLVSCAGRSWRSRFFRGSGGSTAGRRISTRGSTAGSPTRCATCTATSTILATTTVRCTSTCCSSVQSLARAQRLGVAPAHGHRRDRDRGMVFPLRAFPGPPRRARGRRWRCWFPRALMYFQRDAIHEAWLVFFLVLGFWGICGLCQEGGKEHLWATGLALAGMILTKETYIIHVGCLGIACACVFIVELLQPSRRTVLRPGRRNPAARPCPRRTETPATRRGNRLDHAARELRCSLASSCGSRSPRNAGTPPTSWRWPARLWR